MSKELVNHWENLHQSKFADVGWWQNREDLWLDLISDLQLPKESAIIDVGAGASLLLDALSDTGFSNLSALDISSAAISRLKERLENSQVEIKYSVGDVLHFKANEKFQLWYDRAVFHFLLTSKEQNSYVAVAADSISADGYLVLATFAPDGPEKCSGLPVFRHTKDSLAELFADHFNLEWASERMHLTPSGGQQNFTICRFRRIES
ncbi:MAG: class I SAM-dependent methyltransferase [Streptomycetaceae bacterium]|jgi:2-polyprenyl-3-methyl-5-hydroxy-6-metoxy-1,4-benzoquinol methylase|nr:MAG: class I SAM-dependent methyltransferase [Streptomycetaceae bacterium]